MNSPQRLEILIQNDFFPEWVEPQPCNQVDRLPASAKIILAMLQKIRRGRLRLIHPNGFQQYFGAVDAVAVSLHIKHWSGLSQIIRKGDIGFAEAYRDGLITTDDLTGLLRLALQNRQALEQAIEGTWWGRLMYQLRHRFRTNTRKGSKKNIHAHYDIGNHFYQRWLDSSMTYSSAWFDGDFGQTLEAAQSAKYQRILDQLNPAPGARILEIGCGWGGFAEHAARQGFEVHGITISDAQLTYARHRIQQAGFEGQVKLEHCDYRDLHGQYDHIVSIEMFEAVGEQFWPGYFRQIFRCLKPGGSAMVQTITIANERFESYRKGTDFIQQYIFPGGMLPCPDVLHALAWDSGLKLDQIDEFGFDYAETLRRWRSAFEKALPELKPIGFDDAFNRIWRFYLCYCEAAFDERATSVAQLRLTRPRRSEES